MRRKFEDSLRRDETASTQKETNSPGLASPASRERSNPAVTPELARCKEEEEEEEDDDCAICLDKFKHRCSVKKWPCGHQFHTKCSKELLKFDTRCPLCRYDLVTGKHGGLLMNTKRRRKRQIRMKTMENDFD